MSAIALRRSATVRDRDDNRTVMAFVGDDVTRQTLSRVAMELKWQEPVIEAGSIAAARQALADTPSPQLLIVDLAEAENPLAEVNALADVCEPGTRVIALGTANDVRLFRSLVAAGVADYLVKPISAADLQRAIVEAGVEAAAASAADKRGRVTAVIGARGGVGASTVALNLSWILSQEMDQKIALIDFDLHFGTSALSLDLETGNGFRDVLQNPSRIDPLFLERASLRVADRLVLLGTEEALTTSRHWNTESFKPLLDELTAAHDRVILDLPRGMAIDSPELVSAAEMVILVVDFSLASLRDTLRLKALVREAAPKAVIRVVANHSRPSARGGVPAAELVKTIGEAIACELPYDAKAAAQAASKGRPVAAVAKNSKPVQALRKLGQGLVTVKSKKRRAVPFARLFRP